MVPGPLRCLLEVPRLHIGHLGKSRRFLTLQMYSGSYLCNYAYTLGPMWAQSRKISSNFFLAESLNFPEVNIFYKLKKATLGFWNFFRQMSQKEMDVYANVALVGDHNCFMKQCILKEYMTGIIDSHCPSAICFPCISGLFTLITWLCL